MKIITGNLIELADQGMFDVIVHGANCFHVMGGGIAKSLKEKWPQVYEADVNLTKCGDKKKLGTFSATNVKTSKNTNLAIVNAYTQYDFGNDKMHVDYEAVRNCFREIKEFFPGEKIGFPKIGAGLAGGDWNVISKIIEEELNGEDFTLVVLP